MVYTLKISSYNVKSKTSAKKSDAIFSGTTNITDNIMNETSCLLSISISLTIKKNFFAIFVFPIVLCRKREEDLMTEVIITDNEIDLLNTVGLDRSHYKVSTCFASNIVMENRSGISENKNGYFNQVQV